MKFNIWIGSDDNANFKTWFFFSIEGVKPGSFVTFTIMNMNNQVFLFLILRLNYLNKDIFQFLKLKIIKNGQGLKSLLLKMESYIFIY